MVLFEAAALVEDVGDVARVKIEIRQNVHALGSIARQTGLLGRSFLRHLARGVGRGSEHG
jgi:hypothetical protein